jgi:hypothetical protein
LMVLLWLVMLSAYLLLLLLLLHDLGILDDLGSIACRSCHGLILLLVGSATHLGRATSTGVRSLLIVFYI